MDDAYYMQQALILARQAFSADEVPVGCVIVSPSTGAIISSAHNLSQHSA